MSKKAILNTIELLKQRLQFAMEINDECLVALLTNELNKKYDLLLDVVRGEIDANSDSL